MAREGNNNISAATAIDPLRILNRRMLPLAVRDRETNSTDVVVAVTSGPLPVFLRIAIVCHYVMTTCVFCDPHSKAKREAQIAEIYIIAAIGASPLPSC